MGEVDPAALQHVALLHQAGQAAAPFGPLPAIAAEGLAVHLFHAFDDEFLELQEKFLDAVGVHRRRKVARQAGF
jgi:hypothetical protein